MRTVLPTGDRGPHGKGVAGLQLDVVAKRRGLEVAVYEHEVAHAPRHIVSVDKIPNRRPFGNFDWDFISHGMRRKILPQLRVKFQRYLHIDVIGEIIVKIINLLRPAR